MGTEYSSHKHRGTLLWVLAVLALALLFSGVVYAAISENINVFYTPASETPELPVLVTVVTRAPEGSEPLITLTGDILNDGNSVITARGFVLGLISYEDPGDTAPEDNGYESMWIEEGVFGVGEFHYQPPDLVPRTDHYGRAFAANSVGWSYGNEVTFNPSPAPPLVDTIANQIPTIAAATAFIVIFILGIAMVTSGLFIPGIICMSASAILATIGISILTAVVNSN